MELVGEAVRYKDIYRLCYVRGPEGILVMLAERIGLAREEGARKGGNKESVAKRFDSDADALGDGQEDGLTAH